MEPSPEMLGGSGSPNDLKKSRIAKACEACRKKKIKCDGDSPSCTNCASHNRECVYRLQEPKRARPKGTKYIETLEKRLERMEELLSSGLLANKSSGTLGVNAVDSGKQSLETLSSGSHVDLNTGKPLPATPGEASAYSTVDSSPNSKELDRDEEPTEEQIEKLSERMYTLVTNNWGQAKFIGSSSSFSIFSPDSIEWISEKTGDTSLQDIIATERHKPHSIERELFADVFRRTIYEPLPTEQDCVSLVQDFFRGFNAILPLYHQPTFMHLVHRQYSEDPYPGLGWFASLNIALAIGHRLRVTLSLAPVEEERKARGYLKNAMGVLAELIVQSTDLLSVQALIGMAYFMHCSTSPQPSCGLIAAAIRLSHGIGLHKRGSGFNFNPVENEQRKRVFFIAYLLDKEISLRMGRPPAQDDDDMNVELPSLEPEDGVGNIFVAGTRVNLFRIMCEFAIIQSKCYKQLYSTEAAKQSIVKLLATVGELDHQLEEWKTHLPVGARPEPDAHGPALSNLHLLFLHFAYYNLLATIHRMSGYWLRRLPEQTVHDFKRRELNPRVFSSGALCVSAARESIYLLKHLGEPDNSTTWYIIYYPLASMITLFGNILQNPQDSTARTDINLIDVVINFLSSLRVEGDGNGNLPQMIRVCSQFRRMANIVLEKQTFPTNKDKGKEAEGQSISPQPSVLSSIMSNQMNGWHDHMTTTLHNELPAGNDWRRDFSNNGQDATTHQEHRTLFDDMDLLHNQVSIGSLSSMANLNSLQQAFIPQDLMNMPMDVDWNWADTFGYTDLENKQFGGDDTLNN